MESYLESYVAKIIRAKSRRRMYFGCFLLVLAIIIFSYQHNYIANLISGPRIIDGKALVNELLSGNIKDININLHLPPNEVYATGYTRITQKVDQATNKVESQTTNSEYYLTNIDMHFLVLEGTPHYLPSDHFVGVIIPLPSDLKNRLVADFNKYSIHSTDISNALLSYVLSNKGMTGLDDFWILLSGIALLGFGILLVLRRITDIEDEKHYAYTILPVAGYPNIDALSDDFIKSKQAGVVEIGAWYNPYKLSNKYLFRNNFFSFKIYPLSQMYWAYKKIIKKRLNFIIPMGKD